MIETPKMHQTVFYLNKNKILEATVIMSLDRVTYKLYHLSTRDNAIKELLFPSVNLLLEDLLERSNLSTHKGS